MTLALLGNPNSGKTTLFNAMTGMRQHVGNFPGVTVERVQGPLRLSKGADVLVDLPGTYSLTAFSREEAVCGEFLREKPPDAIVNIVDATCPARGLYLTLQLLETGLPVVVAMNLMDEVRAAGGRVDCRALSRALDVPVLPVCAARNEGVEALARAALAAAREGRAPRLPDLGTAQGEARILARYACIDRLCARAVAEGTSAARRRTAAADAVLTHRIWAFPIFLGVMGLVFFLTFGPLGGLLSQGFRRALEGAGALLETALARMGAADWLRAMMVEGVWAGVGCVLSFLPTILTLFFLLSLLEDSGYMARMAFVADRALRRLGLSGRSLAPALLGFGCSVPAILATRTLPSRRDRQLTILLIPFLSCSAKLPIYAMFARAFFPGHAARVMLLLYALGVLLAVPAALLLRGAAFPGEAQPFVLELPAYRMPTLRAAWRLMRVRAAAFVRCALTTLLLASVALWALQRVDWALRPVPDAADSALAAIGRAVAPLFAPLGFGDWRAATALLSGLLAKEGVLAALSVLLAAPTEAALSAALPHVFTPLAAVSFLVFTLLYTPCMAAFAAARRELGGLRWALGGAAFQTAVAWLAACLTHCLGAILGVS